MTLDLSAVTDSLIDLVKEKWDQAPIWAELGGSPAGPTFIPRFSGQAPDVVRQEAGTQLSMYLYHVEPDNARETLFWEPQILDPPEGEPSQYLPLALNLYYLLFAYSDISYSQEQEAMSVALRVFHANPILRSAQGTAVPWELSLTMENRSYDELSRLWQATTAPLRMSLVYRAAVVFIEPETMPSPAPLTRDFSVAADAVTLPVATPAASDYPTVFGTFREGAYAGPAGTPVPFSQSPATAAAGQTFWLLGSGLGVAAASDHVYLLPAAGAAAEVDVTSWAVPDASSPAKFVLALPRQTGTAPGQSPAPGVYQLRAGGGTLGSPGATRSGATPVSIAAFVDPAGNPVLTGAGPFTVHGAGFTPGATEVLVGSTPLTTSGAAPGPGEVKVDPSGSSFAFAPPAAPAGTTAPVRVRVNGVESDPALWVTS